MATREVAVRCFPAESVGGDFYTFNRLGRGRVGVMLGDVSSHGFSAALVMALVMSAAGIHAAAVGHARRDPERAARQPRRPSWPRPRCTSACSTACSTRSSGRLAYANAGHPYAFRVPAEGDPERLEATAPPLGLADRGRSAAAGAVGVGDDLLCLWTDGLVDAAERGRRALRRGAVARRALRPSDRAGPEAIVAAVLAASGRVRRRSRGRSHVARPAALTCRGPSGGSASISSPIPGSSPASPMRWAPAPGDTVLEIGPGPGGLTEALVARGRAVVAIEKDARPGAGGSARGSRASRSSRATRSSSIGTRSAGRRCLGRRQHPLQHHLAADRPGADSAAAGAHRVPGAEGGGGPDRRQAGRASYGALTVGVQAVARAERLFRVPGRRVPSAAQGGLRGGAADAARAAAGARRRDVLRFRRFVVGLFGFRRKQLGRGLRELTGWPPERVAAALAGRARWTRRPAEDAGARPQFVALLRDLVDGGGRAARFVKHFTKSCARSPIPPSDVSRSTCDSSRSSRSRAGDGKLRGAGLPGRDDVRPGAEGSLVLRLLRQAGAGLPGARAADRLREILGLNRRYRVVVIGAGKIGSALVQYRGFRQRGFDIVAIFDMDPSKIGRQWNGLTVRSTSPISRRICGGNRSTWPCW